MDRENCLASRGAVGSLSASIEALIPSPRTWSVCTPFTYGLCFRAQIMGGADGPRVYSGHRRWVAPRCSTVLQAHQKIVKENTNAARRDVPCGPDSASDLRSGRKRSPRRRFLCTTSASERELARRYCRRNCTGVTGKLSEAVCKEPRPHPGGEVPFSNGAHAGWAQCMNLQGTRTEGDCRLPMRLHGAPSSLDGQDCLRIEAVPAQDTERPPPCPIVRYNPRSNLRAFPLSGDLPYGSNSSHFLGARK
jgi:hypothetical protein